MPQDPRQFRFHTGSIKSKGSQTARQAFTQFRFHTGSIKNSLCLYEDKQLLDCFNSILVRLKVKEVHSYKPLLCFNSILVRLKVRSDLFGQEFQIGFNSILVRLKVAFGYLPVTDRIEFQFHTGSIKSFADCRV